MIFKKFIGALTALVMTMTAFVGLAVDASALTFTSTYNLQFMLDSTIIATGSSSTDPSQTYYPGASYTDSTGNAYVVINCTSTIDTNSSSYNPATETVSSVYNTVITLRNANTYTATIAAYSSIDETNVFLGNIGSVSVSEAATSFTYNYPEYVVSGNELYSLTDSYPSYSATYETKVATDISVPVYYNEVSEYASATSFSLSEPTDAPDVPDNASNGDAGISAIIQNLTEQGEYTFIVRYSGSVSATLNNQPIDFTEPVTDTSWVEVTGTFRSTNASDILTITPVKNSYIDYVLVIRTDDAMSTLAYENSGLGSGHVSVNNTLFNENNSTYSVAVGSSLNINITAENGSYIEGISFGDESIDVPDEATSYAFMTTMPANDAILLVEFEELLPTDEATHIQNFDEGVDEIDGVTGASLWEGTLTGRGAAFNPFVTVTLNNGERKTAISNTTIDGNGSIIINVVVDRLNNDISSVILSGVSNQVSEKPSADYGFENESTISEEVE